MLATAGGLGLARNRHESACHCPKAWDKPQTRPAFPASPPGFPERKNALFPGLYQSRKRKLAPYFPYLRQRGHLELQTKGRSFFARSRSVATPVLRFTSAFNCRVASAALSEISPTRETTQTTSGGIPHGASSSSRRGSFLMILSAENLRLVQRQHVEQICQASEELHMVYRLSQAFVTLLKERQRRGIGWMAQTSEKRVK